MESSEKPESLQSHDSLDEIRPSEEHKTEDSQQISTNLRSDGEEPIQPDSKAEILPDTAKTEQEKEYEYITGLKLMLIIAAVTLTVFLILLDSSIVTTVNSHALFFRSFYLRARQAIPQITSDFNSLNDIGWYGSAYLLASCSFQPLAGKLYSQFSSKVCFMAFVFVFEVGSLLCGVAQSSNMLIIGRAVAGLGASGIQNGALTIISACVPLEKRGAYIGFMMGFLQLGALLGPLIGGVFTEYASWRWCFYVNLPAGGVALLFIVFLHIPERRVKSTTKRTFRSTFESLDVIGFCLFAPTAIQFLLALEWGGSTYAWGSAKIIGLFFGSAGNLAVFLAWEQYRGDKAMIPLAMMKHRVVWSACLTIFFIFANMLTTTYYLAVYFQAVRGETPTISGVDVLPTILSTMFTSVGSGVLVGRVGYYLPFSIASGVLASIGSGLMSTLNPGSSKGKWIGYQLISGFGRGGGMQMPILAIQNNIEPTLASIAMAIVVFFQTFGGAVFLSFDQTIFSNDLVSGLHKYAPEVDAAAVVQAGATGFRDIVAKSSVDGVLKAYSHAVNHVFYLAAGTAFGAFVVCWGMGWKNIKKPKPKKDGPEP
ncbi:Efflux pump mlcE [Hyphodiscus hymeniophilus]|uniref:Efflux pump mlcE n=1 Tax=Hyphodiscus hymeniophilus TaxID=353542 RepID=A0A9P6VQA6_9HELO|nr:Efflux pump mlcE [Hyphodiscus hymeniophilus]